MSRILLVTQQPRGYGEFRKPLVRALYRRYVERYRRQVANCTASLAVRHEVTGLADRGLIDESRLPADTRIRY